MQMDLGLGTHSWRDRTEVRAPGAKFAVLRPNCQPGPASYAGGLVLPARRGHDTALDEHVRTSIGSWMPAQDFMKLDYERCSSRLWQLGIGLVLATGALCGCRREAVDEDPARLAREFIERMQRVHGDPKNSRAVFELLWSSAQKNLTERAARTSALAGRKVEPEEMIVPSRFTLRFEPKRISSTTIADRALVAVQGDPPLRETREIRCVREDGRWRVVLDLPSLPPIQKRPDSTGEE